MMILYLCNHKLHINIISTNVYKHLGQLHEKLYHIYKWGTMYVICSYYTNKSSTYIQYKSIFFTYASYDITYLVKIVYMPNMTSYLANSILDIDI